MEVFNWTELEDGGANFDVEMTQEELIIFAKIGIISTLVETAKGVTKNEGFYRTLSELDRPVSDS